jgi:predicted GH43/DUF377 family glycosyl hydrolase
MFKLKRISDKPILTPIRQHEWEREAVLNCGVAYHDGVFHMVYRASDRPFGDFTQKYVTRFGYAVSKDGVNFTRLDKPVFDEDALWAEWGVEDPRIARIGDTYYVTYSTWDGNPEHIRARLATTKDFIVWNRHGVLLDEVNKDVSLFPERIGGRHVLIHRRYPAMWVGFSDDLRNWTNHRRIMEPRPGKWDSWKVGIAGPPVKREDGWLLIYHGVDDRKVYRLGAALLDAEDVTMVIARQDEPILEPELEWEVEGQVPNVVFSCATVEVGDCYYVYYSGADTVIGLATIESERVEFRM